HAIHHQNLHPFPTRRSSDLKTERQTANRRNASGADAGCGQELPSRGIHQEAAGVAGGATYCGVRKRDALKQELAFAKGAGRSRIDRKSTRLNSSHEWISYAV